MTEPHAVLGLRPGATSAEVTAAYRALAKRFHPDVAAGAHAAARMAQINAAYDALRGAERPWASEGSMPKGAQRAAAPAPAVAVAGGWLPEETRRALGRELLAALEREEDVELVSPASTWASPVGVLALTDRRLLWLLDDAVTHRVRSLRFRDIQDVERRLTWPRRRRAELRVETKAGRRHAFADLRPAIADAIVRKVQGQDG